MATTALTARAYVDAPVLIKNAIKLLAIVAANQAGLETAVAKVKHTTYALSSFNRSRIIQKKQVKIKTRPKIITSCCSCVITARNTSPRIGILMAKRALDYRTDIEVGEINQMYLQADMTQKFDVGAHLCKGNLP